MRWYENNIFLNLFDPNTLGGKSQQSITVSYIKLCAR
jgi:hypothetical protein